MRTEHKILLALTALTASTLACVDSVADSSASGLPPGNPTATPAMSEAGTMAVPTPNHWILTPENRAQMIVDQGNAAASKGREGLIAEGFPVPAIDSQRKISTGWRYDVNSNGFENPAAAGVSCDVTLVNVPQIDAYLLIGITHCFSEEVQTDLATEANRITDPNAQIKNMSLTDLHVADKYLPRGKFGVASIKDPNLQVSPNGHDGVTVVFIPKANLELTPEERVKWDTEAVKLSNLWFEEIPEGAKFFAYGKPAGTTNGNPTVMKDGVVESITKSTLNVKDYYSGWGASGNGIFMMTIDGQVYVVSVLSAIWPDNIDLYNTVTTYRLSAVGLHGFMQLAADAQTDLLNHATP